MCIMFCLTLGLLSVIFCTVIGASLSEHHTSMTSLRMCVCIYACLLACLLAWTDHLPEILNKRV